MGKCQVTATTELQPVSTGTPRVEQEEGAEFAAYKSGCNHRCKFIEMKQKICLIQIRKHAQ